MDIDAASDVDSKAYRALEAVTLSPLVIPLLFGVAVLVGGAAFVGEGRGAPIDQFVSLYQSVIVLFLAAIGTLPVLLVVGTLTSIHFDMQAIKSSTVGWNPSSDRVLRWRYLLSPVVGIYYLYKRHQHIPDRGGHEWWYWLLAASTFAPVVVLLSVGALFYWSEHGGFMLLSLGTGICISTVFPVAIYQDAKYARWKSADWKPNPAVYLGLALVSMFLLFAPFVGGYYLHHRNRMTH